MKKQTFIIPTIIALGVSLATNRVYADSASTDFSITVQPSASLSVSAASVNLDITPNKTGVYDSAELTVTASTNSTAGYTLVMETDNTALESSTVNPTTGTKPTIPSIIESQSGISAADFEASTDSSILNHWGLAIGNSNFNAIKSEQTIKTTDTNITNDTTTLSMASKLDLNTVPGVYSTTLNFQLTANTPAITLEDSYAAHSKAKATISGNQYYSMQDMSTSICEYANVVPSSLQVYDSRDNTIYTIGKLADNRCWLLDNLALDLTNSSVQSAMNSTNTNADADTLTSLFSGNRNNGNNYATSGVSNWSSGYSYSAPLINTNSKNMTRSDLTNPDDSMTESDNWKFGIYYNFCAASAGSFCYGDDTDAYTESSNPGNDAVAEYDICPTGWKLPTAYGADSDYGTLYFITPGTNRYNILRSALRMPLAGYYDNGAVLAQGSYTYTHSANVQSPTTLAVFRTTNQYFVYSDSEYRRFGITIRCIAK